MLALDEFHSEHPLLCHYEFSKVSNRNGREMGRAIARASKERSVSFKKDEHLKVKMFIENDSEHDHSISLNVSSKGWHAPTSALFGSSMDLGIGKSESKCFEFHLIEHKNAFLPTISLKSSADAQRGDSSWTLTIDAGEWTAHRTGEIPFVGIVPHNLAGKIARTFDQMVDVECSSVFSPVLFY